MKKKEFLLKMLCGHILARNKKFKNKHKGETCYIFGAGASLKHMDLSVFSDKISIGINMFCLHKDSNMLDMKYYAVVEPFFFYPYFKNPYTKRYQKNIVGCLFKRAILKHNEINLFTSISNIFGANIKNTFYLHHFEHRQVNRKVCDISDEFSFMAGGLYSAIGLAINLGFDKAILVGCDYTFSPISDGHLYTPYPPNRSNGLERNTYKELLSEVNEFIDLSVITDEGGSNWLPSQTYETYSGKKKSYRENTEIVKPEYLDILYHAYKLGQFVNPYRI